MQFCIQLDDYTYINSGASMTTQLVTDLLLLSVVVSFAITLILAWYLTRK